MSNFRNIDDSGCDKLTGSRISESHCSSSVHKHVIFRFHLILTFHRSSSRRVDLILIVIFTNDDSCRQLVEGKQIFV